MKKKPPYRPTKLTDRFIIAANEVINEEINAIILTDEELLSKINDKLPEEAQVSVETWKDWKAGTSPVEQNKLLDTFHLLIKKALIRQKSDLFRKMGYDDKAWQRWAWIIERKFDDWNIKQKQDLNVKGDLIFKKVSYKDTNG